MFSIRYDYEKKIAEITFSYLLNENKEREFNLNRSFDEPLSRTFEKLTSNLTKQINITQKRRTKRKANEEASTVDDDNDEIKLNIELYNFNDQVIPIDTLNKDAWTDGYKVKLNNRIYSVCVNLPCIKKVNLSKLLLAGFPTIANVDIDEQFIDKTYYEWYISETDKNNNKWTFYSEGLNKKMITLNENCANRYLKLKCIPSDGTREGVPVEVISQNLIQTIVSIDSLPMTQRHKLTQEKLSGVK